MFFPKQLAVFSLFFGSLPATYAAFFYPNELSSLLEHILVDWHGAYASGFSFAITPCTNYVSGVQTLGRETASQWLRVAFHDFVTAHVDEGTGGMDASIGFETLREEDSGSAFNDSLQFFRPFVSSKVSMADLIAISVSVSVGNCGGPQIPVRGGRIDATEDGAFGVPAPETDLETTLEYFANAGFNRVDSIGLTACGHTMGSVHHVLTQHLVLKVKLKYTGGVPNGRRARGSHRQQHGWRNPLRQHSGCVRPSSRPRISKWNGKSGRPPRDLFQRFVEKRFATIRK